MSGPKSHQKLLTSFIIRALHTAWFVWINIYKYNFACILYGCKNSSFINEVRKETGSIRGQSTEDIWALDRWGKLGGV
jgi:hypothetical protein